MENQITQPKKKHKVLKVLLICIGVFIFLLVIAYFTIPHILRQKYLEECNSVTAEEMGSIKVTSNESNAFVYWPIIRGSTWSGYILPEEDRTVYTNAKEIEITIPYEVSGEYDENNVTDFLITAQKGKIISYNRSSGEMVFSQCGAVNVSMYIKYQPSEEMYRTNTNDIIVASFKVDGQPITRQYIVQPAVWTSSKIIGKEPLNPQERPTYHVNVGEEIVYDVQLKESDGTPISGLQLSLVDPAKGYSNPTIISPFTEVPTGTYQAKLTMEKAGQLLLRVKVEGVTTNPQYNFAYVTFTDSQIIDEFEVSPNLHFSFSPSYIDNTGRFFYAIYKKGNEPGSKGHYFQKVYFKDFDENSFKDIDPQNTDYYSSFQVDHSGKTIVVKDATSKSSLYTIESDTSLGYPKYDQKYSNVLEVNGFTDDGKKLVMTLYDAIQSVDTDSFTSLSLIPVDKPKMLTFSPIKDTFYFLTGESNQESRKLIAFDAVTGKIISEADLTRDRLMIRSAASDPNDLNGNIYLVYENTNRKQILTGNCYDSQQLNPDKVTLEVFDRITLEKIKDINIAVDLQDYNDFSPVNLLIDAGKIILITNVQKKIFNCESTPFEIKMYIIDVATEQVISQKTIMSSMGEFYISDGYIFQKNQFGIPYVNPRITKYKIQ